MKTFDETLWLLKIIRSFEFLKIHHLIQSALSVFMSCTVQHKKYYHARLRPIFIILGFIPLYINKSFNPKYQSFFYLDSKIMSNSNESYIREHKLKQLMEFLMEQLLNKKPSNPEKYIIKILERRQSLLAEKPKTVRILILINPRNKNNYFKGSALASSNPGNHKIS